MYALRHIGDGWYWTGDGWTMNTWHVKRMTPREAEEQAHALALIAVNHDETQMVPVVEMIPMEQAMGELHGHDDGCELAAGQI